MTKQPNQKIKAYFLIGLIGLFELAALLGAYAFHYFTRKKMGMLRHMIYLNGKWEKTYPLSSLKWLALILLAILLILLIQKSRKKEVSSQAKIASTLASSAAIILCLASMGFMIFSSSQANRAYYPVSLLLIVATSLQGMLYLQIRKNF